MTNHWEDIKNADMILVMGGNAAEAHPVGFKWAIEARNNNKAKLVVVDPRFTRSAAMSDFYAPVRAGSDIAFLGGVVNYLITNNKIQTEYVRHYTNATFIVGEAYQFNEGIFSGYDEAKRSYDPSTWAYEKGEDGFAKVDMTMEHQRCVFQMLKRHYAGYTPEMVSKICGTKTEDFLKVCEYIAGTSTASRAAQKSSRRRPTSITACWASAMRAASTHTPARRRVRPKPLRLSASLPVRASPSWETVVMMALYQGSRGSMRRAGCWPQPAQPEQCWRRLLRTGPRSAARSLVGL